ncbi:hypothetical protein MANI_027353 [Metarhizium anisopliae]|nr:hypothetical protein MANI_027353 [Metarhizium anisopliae]
MPRPPQLALREYRDDQRLAYRPTVFIGLHGGKTVGMNGDPQGGLVDETLELFWRPRSNDDYVPTTSAYRTFFKKALSCKGCHFATKLIKIGNTLFDMKRVIRQESLGV